MIVDYMMPGIDGASVCASIRQHSKIPVWLYSALAEEELSAIAQECGADAWLSKGARVSTLVERVRRFLLGNAANIS
ncbi:MAG: response regulator [Myxococcota bacterium]